MPVNLSIKNVPDDVADRLRTRAKKNLRSVQGELLTILEEAVKPKKGLTPMQALAEMRALGVQTKDEAVQIIREARDSR